MLERLGEGALPAGVHVPTSIRRMSRSYLSLHMAELRATAFRRTFMRVATRRSGLPRPKQSEAYSIRQWARLLPPILLPQKTRGANLLPIGW